MQFFTYKKGLQSARKFVLDSKEFRTSGGVPYYVSDPELGWTIAPNTVHSSRPYTSDAKGFRVTEINARDDESHPVVSIWGDSMVHGDGVDDSDSWPWMLAEIVSGRFKVTNGGVSGYGSDQGFLRFKKRAKQVKPDIALLSYATADLIRHVNIYRTFLHHRGDFPFLKPRYRFCGSELLLVLPPQTDELNVADVIAKPETQNFLKAYDLTYPRYLQQFAEKVLRKFGLANVVDLKAGTKRQALNVTAGIFSDFQAYCEVQNIQCAVLLLPAYYGQYASGDDFDWLIQKCERIGLKYIDLREDFHHQADYQYDDLYVQGTHYGRRSGEWVARRVAAYLD